MPSAWRCAVALWAVPSALGASSASRPVRSDAEVGRASEWASLPEEWGGASGGGGLNQTRDRLKWHTRRAGEGAGAGAVGGATSLDQGAPHPLGRGNIRCPLEVELLWSTQLAGPVVSAPLAVRSMFGDGGVQLVAPTLVRYLELIEGAEGLPPLGWPLAFDQEDPRTGDDDAAVDDDFRARQGVAPHKRGPHRAPSGGGGGGEWARGDHRGPAVFHGSANVHDVNGDGVDDICISDGDGNVYWVAVGGGGEYLHDYRLTVPKLRLKRDWFAGLEESFTDQFVELSMFHHDGEGFCQMKAHVL